MKLKNANNRYADDVFHHYSYGPTFGGNRGGYDLNVHGGTVATKFGHSYESCTSPELTSETNNYTIKEMEVFQIASASSAESDNIKTKCNNSEEPNAKPIQLLSVGVFIKAINIKRGCLLRAESELKQLEESFKDEQTFIDGFACGDDNDVVTLNVSGTIMVTKRATLCIAEDSVLAQQFDDTKWTEQGYIHVNEWTPDDVYVWARKIDDVSDEVAIMFVENDITGNQLLALNMEGLKLIGIERPGIQCLLLKEIGKLETASQDVSTFVEHGPYCFGKILDHLRLNQLHSEGLTEEPALPSVCCSQKDRFEKVVKYYFPGDSSKFILG